VANYNRFREDFSNIPPPKNSIVMKRVTDPTTEAATVHENNFVQSRTSSRNIELIEQMDSRCNQI
jgi:hypothetical protein